LTYYPGSPYGFAEGMARISWYGMSGTPNVMIDGVRNHVGGAPTGSMFATYHPSFLTRQATASPLEMQAGYSIIGDEVTISANITVDLPVTTSNNQVHFIIARDGLHGQSNMAQAMLTSEPFTLTQVGEGTSVERVFNIDPEWNDEDLRIIVLVQSQSSKEVLQATRAVPDYAGDITIDCEPDGVMAAWTLEDADGHQYTGEGDQTMFVFLTGDYTLTWSDQHLWDTPANSGQLQTLSEDGSLVFTGVYSNGPFDTLVSADMAAADPNNGAALVDFDNDGDLDIHVLNNGAADMLLANDGGNFSNVAAGLLADTGNTRQAAWADLNRDGNLDVYLAKANEANVLLMGDGTGGFTPGNAIGLDDAGDASGAQWVDFNLDGNLDMYLSAAGPANSLLSSFGDLGGGFFVFSPVSGLTDVAGNTNCSTWTDANLDGRLDLYVVNGFSANVLLENSPLGFNDVSGSSGLADVTNGTGAAWGDLDNDGDLDLYLANDGMADRLFVCTGNFLFNQVAGENLGDMGHGRGVVMADLNNDMYLDIYVVRHGETDLMLMNNGNMTFTKAPVGPAEASGPGNAVVCGDLDQDGALDLFITRDAASNVVLTNSIDAGNNWIDLRLTGAANQPDAIGARVVLTAGGVSQTRLVTPSSGYQSQSARYVHFGLGQAGQVDEVQIHWPDSTVQFLGALSVNQHLSIVQGQDPTSGVGDGDHLPSATVLGRAFPNPFNPSTTIEFALAQSGPTRLEVFDLNGRLVRTLINENREAGQHTATWQGRDRQNRPVASGAYFYRLTAADGAVQSGRMVLVK
jgi:hypothetical protein